VLIDSLLQVEGDFFSKFSGSVRDILNGLRVAKL